VAVPHFSVSVVARGSGRSAVLSAAYGHCAKMEFEREARTIDYTRKQGLLHEEFVIPADSPEWLRSMIADRSVSGASEAFWNKILWGVDSGLHRGRVSSLENLSGGQSCLRQPINPRHLPLSASILAQSSSHWN
jgi:hypothetical protein